jgi:hypothetical protein
MIAEFRPEFVLGRLLITPGAIETLEMADQSAIEFLKHHVRGDWGDVCDEDRQANDEALIDGSRLLSAHHTSLGDKLWIMTEAADDAGQRSATTILRPSEY